MENHLLSAALKSAEVSVCSENECSKPLETKVMDHCKRNTVAQ